MTLRARLALGFLTIALLIAVPLAQALWALHHAQQAVAALRDDAFAPAQVLARIRTRLGDLRYGEASLIVNPAEPERVAYIDSAAVRLTHLADSLGTAKVDSLVRTIRRAAPDIRQFAPVFAAALADRNDDLADRVTNQHIKGHIEFLDRLVAESEAKLRTNARERVDSAVERANSASQLAALLIGVALIASAGVAVLIVRSISRPISDLESGMAAVANGEFDHRLEVGPGRTDEFGRLAESYRAMADQLAELDKIKAEFVSVASHELKTPINVIMGYLKLLEENLYGPLSARQGEVVNIMQGQADALARLVQHLLDVSRFQAGAARLEARPMTLRGFLTQLEATYEVLAMQRGITFSVVAAEGIPEVVTWDVDRINEVIGNLLSNAFKFTESGGRVDLVVSALDDAVYIEVRDTGVGIAAQQLPHIFDKFFQADNQHSAGTKGSGLGLAISKEIVEAHGGSIAVESTVGTGTKFSIMLPVSAAAATTSPRTSEEPIVTAGATA